MTHVSYLAHQIVSGHLAKRTAYLFYCFRCSLCSYFLFLHKVETTRKIPRERTEAASIFADVVVVCVPSVCHVSLYRYRYYYQINCYVARDYKRSIFFFFSFSFSPLVSFVCARSRVYIVVKFSKKKRHTFCLCAHTHTHTRTHKKRIDVEKAESKTLLLLRTRERREWDRTVAHDQ